MRIRKLLVIGTILGAPGLAVAQPVTGLYVGAGAGANFLQNETVKRLNTTNGLVGGHGSNPKYDSGAAGVASIGYGFGNGFRVELEGNYRWNEARSVGGYGKALSGSEDKYGAMVNGLYDFDLTPYGITFMSPYIGAGAGWAHNQADHLDYLAQDGISSRVRVNNGVDAFAYQAIAGVSFPVYSVLPGLSLTAEYRFYSTPEDRSYKVQYFAPNVTTGGRVKVSDDSNHSVMFGLRYAFNTAAPPPPPAPAPVPAAVAAPSRSYLVFFDWDRADLTDRARQIISEAAQNSTRVQYTRIEVDGHADRSGTPQYNQGLSLRRAQTVAGELVRDGVPQTAINIQAFGDTRPLVPTAAGVREPQNRRVEIILR